MDIEFLDCDYESVELDELAATRGDGTDDEMAGEEIYLGWFIDRASGANRTPDWQRV